MKKLFVTLCVLHMAAQAVMASGLGLFGSYWKAKDPDEAFMGAGAKIQMSMAPGVALEVRGSYMFNEEKAGGMTAKLEVIPAEAGLMLNLAPTAPVRPYLGGGAGYYLMSAKISGGGRSESASIKNELGFWGVGGLQLMFNEGVGLFAEGKYTMLKIKEIESTAVDVKLDGFGGQAGLMFAW